MSDMVCDMHIHTKFSCDSKEELERYCCEALKNGVKALCFTDHVDFNKNDFGYGFYNPTDFFIEFNEIKDKYSKKIKLLCGIEFSEPHLYKDELLGLGKLPYDYIIGSIHYWYNDMFPSLMIKDNIPIELCYEYYWKAVYSEVISGGFDCLGHFDFPKRYYGRVKIDNSILPNIFYAMIRNNICLEINTSSLRKNVFQSMPDREILSIYKACGGAYITIGSDAHIAEDLAADYKYAKDLISYYDFKEVYFQKRKRIELC